MNEPCCRSSVLFNVLMRPKGEMLPKDDQIHLDLHIASLGTLGFLDILI